jgi:hypothetical protein
MQVKPITYFDVVRRKLKENKVFDILMTSYHHLLNDLAC